MIDERASRRIEFLTGLDRTRVPGELGLRAVRDLASHMVRGGPVAAWRRLRRRMALATGLEESRLVRFGRYVFFDSFTPPHGHPAFDRMVDRFAAGEPPVGYAVFAISRRCMYRCEHCYAAGMLGAAEALSRDDLLRVTDSLLELEVGLFSIEGGEPLLRADDVLAMLDRIGDRAATSLATTGFPLTRPLARELAARGLITAHVSLDHPDPAVHNRFRKSPKAFERAVAALQELGEAGVFPVLAVCATRALLAEGGLERLLELARSIGVGMVEVLDPIPSGNYLEEPAACLDAAGIAQLKAFQATVNQDARWRSHPAISARCHLESEDRFGCGWGGNGHLYIDARGHVQPCVYTQLSVGNLLGEEPAVVFARMRTLFPRPVGLFCPAYAVAADVAAARRDGVNLPTPPEVTARICERFRSAPLPLVSRRAGEARDA